jgi:hypothetical protein
VSAAAHDLGSRGRSLYPKAVHRPCGHDVGVSDRARPRSVSTIPMNRRGDLGRGVEGGPSSVGCAAGGPVHRCRRSRLVALGVLRSMTFAWHQVQLYRLPRD